MDLNPETTGNLMDSDNDGWGWAELLTSPGYTLVLSFPIICLVIPNSQHLSSSLKVAGMLCGVLANLLSKQIAPVARIPRDLATK